MPEQPSVQPLIAETSDHSISSHTPTTMLAVRGLHICTTEEDVAGAFRQFAMIKKCTVVRDSVTQLSKGFAFVEFNALEYAVHVVNTLSSLTLTIDDCAVRVFYARPHALEDQLRHSNLAAAAQDAAARRQQSLPSQSLPTAASSSSSSSSSGPVPSSASASSSSSPDWPPPFERAGAAYVLHPQSGCFYEPQSQFYYSPLTRLYYSCRYESYFRFDPTATAVSSQGEIGAFRPCVPPPVAAAVAAPELVDGDGEGAGEGEAAGSERKQLTTPAVAHPDTLDSLSAASRSSKTNRAGKGPTPAASRVLVEPVIISVGAAAAISTESALVQQQGATDHHPSATTNGPSQSEAEAGTGADAESTSRYRDRASERRDMYARAEAPPGLPVSALPRGAPTSAPALVHPPPAHPAYPASASQLSHSLFDNPSNPGATLLRNMGWTEGRGLGKSEQGLAVPLGVEIRPPHQPTSKAGLGAPRPPHAKGRVKVNYHGSKEEFKASLKDAARARFEQLGEK